MNRPLTDRERCLQLEARVAVLEEELAAYRGNAADDARDEAARQRVHRTIAWLGARRAKESCAELLLDLMDHAGRLRTRHQLLNTLSPGNADDLGPKMVDVYLCHLRTALRRHDLADVVDVAWGRGLSMSPAAAERVRAAMTAAGFAP